MCDSEWTYLNYTNSCYKAYSNEWKNWTTAQYICRENQANLTSIHSWDENLFLIDLTTTGMTMPPSSQVYHVWIGLYSPNKDMKFQWIDGTNFDAQFWGQSQPWNNPIGDSTVLCADHTPDFDYDYQKWFTDPGSQNERAFVCKKPAKLSC
uniref:C-type lectin domain-containing protein n=1 Tax=Acrobeloides nanus TaxID=290746 RepID=A0A914E7G9_9BILA